MADVSSTLRAWSSTASSNQPQGSTTIGSGLDDNLRQLQATVRQFLADQSTTVVPSAGVADLSTSTGRWVPVSGNSTLTGFGTEPAGIWYLVSLTGSPTINNGNISTPGAVTISGSAGDMFIADSQGSGVWRLHSYTRASGAPLNMSPQSSVIGSTVSLSSSSSYFDGPSVQQGASGTWLAFGKVTVKETAGSNTINAKLWDGTTVIDSGSIVTAANGVYTIALAGYISNPAANLKISCKNTNGSGLILPSNSGEGRDSSITAIRIG